MNFQNQVSMYSRTQAEIDAERQGQIMVYPLATKTGNECFPCLAIEVFRTGQPSQKTWLDLRKLGRHFDTMEAALDAAKKVKVISVDEAGDVKWEWAE
ncbi:hypothetical protein IGS59_27505 [Janthinobacterium sp. GW460P]|uniref:hypothetical protein n=1 Tax=unclassified Janthinobacterium TaxID=2610881 RepID=UPI000A31F801|nr:MULTISPECIES: hypothetical protein [unclassified Janthinobacterium]MCC7705998.1 hypothetical protein [Janthinobacterium sp. GW460P]MCC7711500.1 hypothetical protein [Janthinobacterium sp. GW460W]